MNRAVNRWWVAECSYPGFEPFLFGNVEAKSELDAELALKREWTNISPHPVPKFTAVIPGQLIFKDD